jgi:hypothetical protein
MITLCTLSDYSYLPKGLALFESLKRHTKVDFKLHYLCLDHRSYKLVNSIDDDRIQAHYSEGIPELCQNAPYYQHREDTYTRRQHYCWSLASRFSYWLMMHDEPDWIHYVDSDVMFFEDFKILQDELDDNSASFGVVPHLHNYFGAEVGAFNVCVTSFKRDQSGMAALTEWKHLVCRKNNPESFKYGKCGDQGYLELITRKHRGCHILGQTFAQVAPWNFRLYDVEEESYRGQLLALRNRSPMCDEMTCDKALQLLFAHFSHFEHSKDGKYITGELNYGNFITHDWIKGLYKYYNEMCVKAVKDYKL